MLSLPRPVSRKLYMISPQKLKLRIRNHTTAFMCYNCRWPCRYFEVIRLFHIKFFVNGAYVIRQKSLQTTNRKAYTSFRLVPLFVTPKDIEGQFSPDCHFRDGVSRNYHKWWHSVRGTVVFEEKFWLYVNVALSVFCILKKYFKIHIWYFGIWNTF